MTFQQFRALERKQKVETIWSEGVRIGDRVEGVYKIFLYQVDAFYVELYYYHTDYKIIRRLKSFSSIEYLQPYLDWMIITI